MMKLSTELKILIGVAAAVLLFALYRRIAGAIADATKPAAQAIDELNQAQQTIGSTFDANEAPPGGISLNDAVNSGIVANPVLDRPWWKWLTG